MTRPFTGWHMAAITISFFAVIIAVNLTMACLRQTSWTGLVVENSYVASQSFNRDAEIARQQQALGWQMNLSVKRSRRKNLILDRENLPMAGLRIRAVLQRPTDEAGDQVLKLQEDRSRHLQWPTRRLAAASGSPISRPKGPTMNWCVSCSAFL